MLDSPLRMERQFTANGEPSTVNYQAMRNSSSSAP